MTASSRRNPTAVRKRLFSIVGARGLHELHVMPFINVKLIEGVFSASQKRELIEKITDVVVALEGERMRQFTLVIIDEVKSGDWGLGGKAMTKDDVESAVRGESGRRP